MYAIVEINGQQFKVEEGKKLFVNHMKDVEAGKTTACRQRRLSTGRRTHRKRC